MFNASCAIQPSRGQRCSPGGYVPNLVRYPTVRYHHDCNRYDEQDDKHVDLKQQAVDGGLGRLYTPVGLDLTPHFF